jgi:hypothetical protein
MDIFSINLSLPEIQTLRQSLDVITIAGKDAKFVASLQIKLEQEINQINEMLANQEIKKQQDLQKAIQLDSVSSSARKSK